jgi:two-component system, NarL family, nitrate/nitrite response regulator NarL
MSAIRGSEDRTFPIDQSPEPALRALIVDRDAMSSHLLAEALVRSRRCDTAAIPAGDLLRTLAAREVDLLIISADLTTASGSGLDLAEAVGRAYPKIMMIVLLKQADHHSIITSLKAGARGIFSRQRPMTEFLDCVDHVRKGYLWAGKEETDTLLEVFRSIPTAPGLNANPSLPLTKRELEVVQCAATGKTNRAIASELGLSEHTVKNYLFRSFEKLGVSSRSELLFYLTTRGHSVAGAPKDDQPYSATPRLVARTSRPDGQI